MTLTEALYKTGITLKPIEPYASDFGPSYKSPYVKGSNKFYEMIVPIMSTKVGEIEYGDVDNNTIEIISIHINSKHRGKGLGQQAITQLVRLTNKKTVIAMAAPSSKMFWKKFGFAPMPGAKDYFTKTF